jgi:hypothetical protein
VSFLVNVNKSNVPPAVAGIVEQTLEVGRTNTVVLTVTDEAPATVRLAVTPTAVGVVVAQTNYAGGKWQLTLRGQKEGQTQVTVVATDERGQASQPVSFPVNVNKSNAPPVATDVERLKALNMELECFKVWFRKRKSDPSIIVPPGYPDAGRPARRLVGDIGPGREFYKRKALNLEQRFTQAAQSTPELTRTFRDLVKTIEYWW